MLKLLTLNNCNADTLRQPIQDDKWQHLPKLGLLRIREKNEMRKEWLKKWGGKKGKNNQKKEKKKDWKGKKKDKEIESWRDLDR